MSARRAPRSLTLTMTGYQAAWFFRQDAELAERPKEATQACACCDTIYPTAGLKPIESYEVYARASEVVSFERDDLVCKFCREDFQADFGQPDTDVYHIFDRGIDPRD
jgi:hypothetical protein